jgi:hypothetical protein
MSAHEPARSAECVLIDPTLFCRRCERLGSQCSCTETWETDGGGAGLSEADDHFLRPEHIDGSGAGGSMGE